MKRFLIVAAICVVAAPAFAGSDLLPVKGVVGTRAYDLATGQQTPVVDQTRVQGPSIWAAVTSSGYFWGGQGEFEIYMEWGDLAVGAAVGGFGFSYATNADPGFECLMMFYNSENGRNTQPKLPNYVAAAYLTGLAGTPTPANRNLFWGWIYSVEWVSPISLDGADLDNDALSDFGYTAWWDWSTFNPGGPPNQLVGPRICGDPNIDLTATGIEDGFDLYNDPGYIPQPGYFDPNLTHYVGGYYFGGPPIYSQFYMELFAPGCPNRGDSGRYCQADIANFNCIVDLPDLAQLLGSYGITAGATLLDGDVYPPDPFFPGDGAVNLQDLSEMLGQYGDDCNL